MRTDPTVRALSKIGGGLARLRDGVELLEQARGESPEVAVAVRLADALQAWFDWINREISRGER